MTSEAPVAEGIHEWIDARVEGDDDDGDNISDVAIMLVFIIVIEHVNN